MRRGSSSKGDFAGVFYALSDLPGREAAGGGGVEEFVLEGDFADAGIVCVDGGEETVVEEEGERMLGERCDGAGLDVTRGTAFDADAVFSEKIDEAGVFGCADSVSDAGGTEKSDGVPDAFGSGGFAGVDGDTETGVAHAVEVISEKTGREAGFVAGEVDGDEMLLESQKGIKFAAADFGPERAAEDADQFGGNIKIAAGGSDAVGYSLDDGGRRDAVRLSHKVGAEAEFDIVESLGMCIGDVFVSDAAAVVGRLEDADGPTEFFEEFEKTRLGRRDGDEGAKAFFIGGWEDDTIFFGEFEDRAEPDVAVEVPMEIDPTGSAHG